MAAMVNIHICPLLLVPNECLASHNWAKSKLINLLKIPFPKKLSLRRMK